MLALLNGTGTVANGVTYHLRKPTGSDNVTRMNQAIQMPRRLFNLFSLVVVAVQVEHVCDKVERILVILDLGIQAGQVESVCQVVFVDLAKVLVPS
jgi:hypothetical protein